VGRVPVLNDPGPASAMLRRLEAPTTASAPAPSAARPDAVGRATLSSRHAPPPPPRAFAAAMDCRIASAMSTGAPQEGR